MFSLLVSTETTISSVTGTTAAATTKETKKTEQRRRRPQKPTFKVGSITAEIFVMLSSRWWWWWVVGGVKSFLSQTQLLSWGCDNTLPGKYIQASPPFSS